MDFALSGGTATDFYKPGHGKLYPFGTTRKYSNFTPRSAKNFLASKSCSSMYDNKVVNFGLYGTWQELVELWDRTFFNVSKKKAIKAIKRRFDNACGLDVISVDQIAALHDIGFLPLTVLAIEEGARVNIGVPLWTVFNSEEYPDQYWLVNYLETITSAYNWKSICNATIAFEYRRICEKWAALTCDNKDHVKFQCHDFSFRGMSGPEDAMRSGAAHLTSFVGTDTIPAIDYLEKHYNANSDLELLGASVTATEHAVATANILTRLRAKLDMIAAEGKSISHETIDELKTECEREYILEIILEKVKTGIISLVCDSFDFWAIISKVLPSIRKEIESRIKNELGLAKVVVRPDCYSSDTSILTPAGWKLFSELTEDDMVAQVTNVGTHEFVKPSRIINQEYEGDMHVFKDFYGKVDLMVTPNHRMVLGQLDRTTGKYVERITEASKLDGGNYLQNMYRSARSSKTGKSLTPMERLNIAFQADGSYKTLVDSSVRFHFTKERKIHRMLDLLHAGGIDYTLYEITSGGYEFNVKVPRSEMHKDFNWVDVDDLHSDWCAEFIDELKHWDGSVRNDGRIKYDTTNPVILPVVELIAISAGYGCLISKSVDNRQDHFSDVYTAHIMLSNRVGGQSWEHTIVPYKGTVHCVTVPTGKVLVKRNKCTMVSGNSGNPVLVICGYRIAGEHADLAAFDAYLHNNGTVDGLDGEVVKVGDNWHVIRNRFASGFVEATDYLGEIITEAEVRGAVESLWGSFGGTVNAKGYKVLNEYIGLIYGDSITVHRCEEIFERLEAKGFASSNIVLGVGSFTYQYSTRDTFGMAMKATACEVMNQLIELYKDPKTASSKKSAKGFLRVVKEGDNYVTQQEVDMNWGDLENGSGELKPLWKNGTFKRHVSIASVRNKLDAEFA